MYNAEYVTKPNNLWKSFPVLLSWFSMCSAGTKFCQSWSQSMRHYFSTSSKTNRVPVMHSQKNINRPTCSTTCKLASCKGYWLWDFFKVVTRTVVGWFLTCFLGGCVGLSVCLSKVCTSKAASQGWTSEVKRQASHKQRNVPGCKPLTTVTETTLFGY